MKKLSLKKMKIAAMRNANFVKGGNETIGICDSIMTMECTANQECIETMPAATCSCEGTNPGTTTPNNTDIKTRHTCPLGVGGLG
ncbi:MAG: hypothetical protein AAF611_01955 [Bacteroidota bacterium]